MVFIYFLYVLSFSLTLVSQFQVLIFIFIFFANDFHLPSVNGWNRSDSETETQEKRGRNSNVIRIGGFVGFCSTDSAVEWKSELLSPFMMYLLALIVHDCKCVYFPERNLLFNQRHWHQIHRLALTLWALLGSVRFISSHYRLPQS